MFCKTKFGSPAIISLIFSTFFFPLQEIKTARVCLGRGMASFMKKIGFLPVACVLGFCLFGGGFLFVFNKDSSLTVIILQLIQGTEGKGMGGVRFSFSFVHCACDLQLSWKFYLNACKGPELLQHCVTSRFRGRD